MESEEGLPEVLLTLKWLHWKVYTQEPPSVNLPYPCTLAPPLGPQGY